MVAKKKDAPAPADAKAEEKPKGGWGANAPKKEQPKQTPSAPSEDSKQADIEDVTGKPDQPTAGAAAPDPGTAMESGGNLSNAAKSLIGYVERVERLAEERAAIQQDIKELFAEIKAAGFSTPIVREAIRRRAMDPAAREEHDSLLAIYEESLR